MIFILIGLLKECYIMQNDSLFGGLPAVLAFLLVSYILMWIFC